jgi:hypothetical protein
VIQRDLQLIWKSAIAKYGRHGAILFEVFFERQTMHGIPDRPGGKLSFLNKAII